MSPINSARAVNTSRISGLASGMDIDAIVKDMMFAKKIPLDKLEQQKQILEWQREDYRTLNTALYSFKDKAFKMNLEGTFNTKSATSSNSAVITATAGASSAAGTYTITVNSLAAGVSKGSTSQLVDEKNGDGKVLTLYEQFAEFGTRGFSAGDNITVNINGTALEFDLDTDTINTVAAKINNANLGVKASYDSTYNRFFLNTIATGSEAALTISSDTAGFLSNDLNSSILKLNIDKGVSCHGVNASVDVGDATGLESATNTITVNGLTLNLKDTGSSTLNVSRDTESMFTVITDFVKAYNDTINSLYSKVQEERYRDYKPLTEAQKENMKDDEITKWEKKARSGLLRNDQLLQNTISNLRSAMSRVVDIDGQYNRLSQIGITTRSYMDNGKLYIDESALRKALSDDPEGVKDLFTNYGSTTDQKGIADKLYNVTTDGVKYLADKAGSASSFSTVDNSYIGKRLTEMDKVIENWQKKLEDIENRYYKKFTAMETALNKMNAQSLWLTQQFGAGSSGA